MKYLTHTLTITGLVASFGSAAFAQDVDYKTFTCADFAGISAEEQSSAYISLKDIADLKSEPSDAAATTDTGDAATTDSRDAAASDTYTVPATGSATADVNETDAGDPSKNTVVTDGTATADMEDPTAEITALLKSCEDNDDALVVDRIQ